MRRTRLRRAPRLRSRECDRVHLGGALLVPPAARSHRQFIDADVAISDQEKPHQRWTLGDRLSLLPAIDLTDVYAGRIGNLLLGELACFEKLRNRHPVKMA